MGRQQINQNNWMHTPGCTQICRIRPPWRWTKLLQRIRFTSCNFGSFTHRINQKCCVIVQIMRLWCFLSLPHTFHYLPKHFLAVWSIAAPSVPPAEFSHSVMFSLSTEEAPSHDVGKSSSCFEQERMSVEFRSTIFRENGMVRMIRGSWRMGISKGYHSIYQAND